jgi:hypothetical protein
LVADVRFEAADAPWQLPVSEHGQGPIACAPPVH